jgi:outer membrane protein insertion porin family
MKRNQKNEQKKFLAFIFSCFVLTISCLPFIPFDATASVVREIEINGLYSIDKEELLYLLDMQPGEQIDEEHVRLGIKRAFLKGIFKDISVETFEGERTDILINVKERDFIEKISIKGDSALSKRKIKQLFFLKEDKVLLCDMLERALKTLRHEIALRGFPHASVHSETIPLKRPHRVKILLTIDTGDPLTIATIQTEDEAKHAMKLSEGDIYNQTKLAKDLERIKKYYKKQKYFNPEIGQHTFTDGVLEIPVRPGKRLNISIVDNHAISTKKLLREMPFFELEAFSYDIVEESVHRVISLYHKKGYLFAQAAPVISKTDDHIDLHFFIYEGQKVKTGEITFTGTSLPEKDLKDVLSLRKGKVYNAELLDTDRERLRTYYIALGYLSVDVEEFQTTYNEASNTVDINIIIHEGLKTEIERIVITGTQHVPEEAVREIIQIEPGDIYNEVDIIDARYRVGDLYNAHGFLRTTVTVESEIEEHKATVTFKIKEGTEILFGKTIVTGNYKTKYGVVTRELHDKENKPYDYRILTRERRKLYKSGLFTDIDITALDRYDHKKDVLLTLREGNPGSVELTLGYATYERFRGILDVSYRNLWGENRQPSLRLDVSSLARRLILNYYEPWFLDKELLQFRAFMLIENKKEINVDTRETLYKLKRYKASAGVEKDVSDTVLAKFYYEFSVVNTYDVQPDVILSKEDVGTLLISGIIPGILYDTRDNIFEPQKGIFSGASVKFTSPLFLSESDFLKFSFFGNYYHALSKRFVFAVSFRGGLARGYRGTTELPIVERYFLGGRTTVRGYEQDLLGPKGEDGNPTGGNAFLMQSLELRASLGKGIGLVAFLDGGNVWLETNDIDLMEWKFTPGIGLRYKTPVGPLRFDYGYKLEEEQGQSRGVFHFSIGHAF